MKQLERHQYCGHSVLMAKRKNDWQDTDKVLGMFGDKAGPARRAYRAFVEKGITQGKRLDLTGGGLVRSAGGWAAVKALKRAKIFGNYSGCHVHGSRLATLRFSYFLR